MINVASNGRDESAASASAARVSVPVGRRCRMTTLAKSPCEVRKTAAAAAARMSPAPSPPPPPPAPRGWMPLKSTVLNPFSTAHGRSERAVQHLRPPQNPSATAAGRRVKRSPPTHTDSRLSSLHLGILFPLKGTRRAIEVKRFKRVRFLRL